MVCLDKNCAPPSEMRYSAPANPLSVPYTKQAPKPLAQLLFAASKLGSTRTWPPSPPASSNHVCELADFRCVPLSCVPPQKRGLSRPAGTDGAFWMDEYCAMSRPVRWITPAVVGFTVPFRSCQSTEFSGSVIFGRPPRSALYQTPPSLPISP